MRYLYCAAFSLALVAAAACSDAGGNSEKGESCTKTDDCASGLRCVGNVCVDDSVPPNAKEAWGKFLDQFLPGYCGFVEKCSSGYTKAQCLAAASKGTSFYQSLVNCDAKATYYVQNRAAIDACLSSDPPCNTGDDPKNYCPALQGMGSFDSCKPLQKLDGGTAKFDSGGGATCSQPGWSKPFNDGDYRCQTKDDPGWDNDPRIMICKNGSWVEHAKCDCVTSDGVIGNCKQPTVGTAVCGYAFKYCLICNPGLACVSQ